MTIVHREGWGEGTSPPHVVVPLVFDVLVFVVHVDHGPRSQGGVGGGNVPPSFSFDHLVVLSLSLSPSLCFDHPVVTVFLICVAVHAFLTRGSGGGAAHPSFITVGPSHEVTLNYLHPPPFHSWSEPVSFFL